MEYYRAHSILTQDKKADDNRRYRNILANSGKEMESGEVRDLDSLYVMSRDGKLILINDLAKNPDDQSEKYSVNFVANHGHNDVATGERVVDVEDIIGDARVWMEKDGLHARVYFANDDPKADHAWAISDNASYSIGTEWYPDGYVGAGLEIDEPIGILREISMVDTGNDPRAMTIDHKPALAQAQGSASTGDGKDNSKLTKGNLMKKELDKLTSEEANEMLDELVDVVVRHTEGSNDAKDESAETGEAKEEVKDTPAEEAPAEEKKDVLRSPVVVIRDRAVKQEKAVEKKTDWRVTKDAKKRFAEIAYQNQGFKGAFDALWSAELNKHGASTNDGITGLGLPVDGEQVVIDALEKSEGLINHFDFIGGKTYLVKLISATEGNNAESARAGGHLKGDTKLFQQLKSDPRQFYNVPVYKKLDIDYLELYENPGLIDIRARELVEARIVEIERAMVIGDGRTTPEEGQPDRRMFRNGRGFYSMVADAADTNGVGSLFATSVTAPAGSNLYDASILAENALRAEGRRIMVAKKTLVTNFRLARLDAGNTGDYILKPGQSIEAALGVDRIYTPAWMDNASCDFVVFVENKPKMTGKRPQAPDMKAFFDTTIDADVLMAEAPNGGGLADYKSAAVVTIATE